MKKAIIISISLYLILLTVKAQPAIYIDSLRINVSTVVAADTIIPFSYEQIPDLVSFDIDYTTLDEDDATIDIVVSNRRGNWKGEITSIMPYTLNVTANEDALTGKASVAFHSDQLPYAMMGLRLKKGTVSSGEIIAIRIMSVPIRRSGLLP